MLNDYQIFDYRVKCSFSILFVARSILESRGKRPARRQALNSEQQIALGLRASLPFRRTHVFTVGGGSCGGEEALPSVISTVCG